MSKSIITESRRTLRSARVRDALGKPASVSRESNARDELVVFLAEQAVANTPVLNSTTRDLVDAAVSVALSRTLLSDTEYLDVLCLAAQTLASLSAFARLRQFAKYFRDLASHLSEQRPFLASVLSAFAYEISGNRSAARRTLTSSLGLSSPETPPISRVPFVHAHVADVVLANAFRVWLTQRSIERLDQARTIAIKQGDALMLSVAEMLRTYSVAADTHAPLQVIPTAEPAFRSRDLENYLRQCGITTLFPAQRDAINQGVLESSNSLVAMPTSSGKTFIAELRIMAELYRKPGARVVYLAPYRLLARQVEFDLRKALRGAKYSVRDFGGSYDISVEEELWTVALPDVAIMTPERLDALMRLSDSSRRGSKEAGELLSSVALVIFDEMQLVGRPSRGPRLELLITRLRSRLPDAYFLSLSAVSEGARQVADWLQAKAIVTSHQRPTGTIELVWKDDGRILQRFGERPVLVDRMDRAGNPMDSAARLVEALETDYLPVLVLETQRGYAERVAEKIGAMSPRDGYRWRDHLTEQQSDELDAVAEMATALMGDQNDLSRLLYQGIAYHHAGVPAHLLRRIEDLARLGALRAVAATTTIAEGAHLPFKVVIIPHLNFGGSSGRLERDLYQNIIGRAGRVDFALEGIIVLLDSNAPSFKNYIEGSLWGESSHQIRGHLINALSEPRTLDEYRIRREAKSQILAWLGDPGTYEENQSHMLAARTFTWTTANSTRQKELEQQILDVFSEFEDQGLAVAASPFQLTELGRRARLAGLGAESCRRIISNVTSGLSLMALETLRGVSLIDEEVADVMTNCIFQSEEVIEHSLWLRKQGLRPSQIVSFLRALSLGEIPWPDDDEVITTDHSLLKGWMLGQSYEDLSLIPPVFSGKGIFSSDDATSRTADVAEYFARLAYPAAWTWSGINAMLGELGEELPGWLSRAVELGVPSETGVQVILTYGVSRHAAVCLSKELSPNWSIAQDQITERTDVDLRSLGLTLVDRRLILGTE